jgi:hypothetical protein
VPAFGAPMINASGQGSLAIMQGFYRGARLAFRYHNEH